MPDLREIDSIGFSRSGSHSRCPRVCEDMPHVDVVTMGECPRGQTPDRTVELPPAPQEAHNSRRCQDPVPRCRRPRPRQKGSTGETASLAGRLRPHPRGRAIGIGCWPLCGIKVEDRRRRPSLDRDPRPPDEGQSVRVVTALPFGCASHGSGCGGAAPAATRRGHGPSGAQVTRCGRMPAP